LNEKVLHTLEFDKTREHLANFTSFSAGRALALSLVPATSYEEVATLQQETSEARKLLEARPNFSLGGARDVSASAHKAGLGGILAAEDFQDIQATLAVARSVRGVLGRLEGPYPLLSGIAAQITELPHLEAEIERTFDARSEVKDSASVMLARIRSEARQAHDRLRERLNEIINSQTWSHYIQEPIVTLRGGRYVVPVKADFKGAVRGIVHDVSGSGATIFVEPLAVVDLGNRWRELVAEEEKEIERILRRLSGLVGAESEAIVRNVECLARIDLALAKAKYANSLRATEPELARGGALRLNAARHPLLTGSVVPITAEVGGGFTVLVVTGPNTGGKTVALKSVGLLTLMAQAGLHIPTLDGSRVPVYRGIYADIGDEQSIEQSLSTFSSHMGNIIQVLKEVDGESLVLLDELGAGTDPAEGSALARAILSHLLERSVTTVVTTHHSELKAYAQVTPGVQNASVEFDEVSLSPTYKLTMGLPGRSNAMAIAARLGLSPAIIEDARGMMTQGQVQVDALLSQIREERDKAAALREAAEKEKDEAARLKQEIAAQLNALDLEKGDLLAQAREAVEEEVRALRERLRRVAAEIQASALAQRGVPKDLAQELASVEEGLRKAPWRDESTGRVAAETHTRLEAGATVWIPAFNRHGEVISGPNDEGAVEVHVGPLRAKLRAEQVEPRAGGIPRQEQTPVRTPSLVGARDEEPPGLEVHLRGMRVEEALEKLDRYLNDAFLAGLRSVRVVHGKGTGTLRQVVREVLSGHPLVKSYRPAERNEGGEGVTVAELAV